MKRLLIIIVVFVLTLNIFSVYRQPLPLLQAKLATNSFSRGDQYFGRLTLWYLYAKQGDWANAAKLEKSLDPYDIINYKESHQPSELKKYVNNLVIKPNKTAEDWIELSRVQSILGKADDAKDSLTKAKNIDPIRDDIIQIFYKLYR
jgi:hypothetical protein